MDHSDVAEQFHHVAADLRAAEAAAGRPAGSVKLVAVSKTHPAERIRPVLEAGHRLFGENRVQEAEAKFPALREAFPDLELHLIGPLQTNKVREAVALFDVIETLDRPKLAAALAREFERQNRRPALYVQVNTGAEPQKAGIAPTELDDFLTACRTEYGLQPVGLMCIPPADQDPMPHFTLLRDCATRNGLTVLSMGMSGDYAEAVQAGATHVRIGSAIFGTRDYGAGR
jgi:pyridoxal phosphate enzyme (YggS family)